MDALAEAVRGDRLLLETFRWLEEAKSSVGYLNAFEKLFGNSPKLSYSWKASVKNMVHRTLRMRPGEILSSGTDDVPVMIGGLAVPLGTLYFEILRDESPARSQTRQVLFHIISAVYGAMSVGRLQSAAALNIRDGLGAVGVKIPLGVFNQLNIQVHYDPEKVLIDSVTSAIDGYIKRVSVDSELESILVRLLDYTVVFDSVFADLTTDRDQIGKTDGQTAPIRKAVHFLFALQKAAKHMDGAFGADSYYHRIPEEATTFTMNYTTAIERVTEQRNLSCRPVYLHGKYTEYFDLITGEIDPDFGGVPFLMPQTSSKPLASVETIRRFAAFLEALAAAECIITLGYGFNADDDHVTNMIFDAMARERKLKLIVVAQGSMDASPGVVRLKERFPPSTNA